MKSTHQSDSVMLNYLKEPSSIELVLKNSKEFSESFFVHRCCSIFNERSPSSVVDSFVIISLPSPFVKGFFKLFSSFFERIFPKASLFGPPSLRRLPDDSPVSIPLSPPLVKNIFDHFSIFYLLDILYEILVPLLCRVHNAKSDSP